MTQKTKQHNRGVIPIIPEHNIIVIGGAGVGKTELIHRFIYSYVMDDCTIEDSWRKRCVIDGKEAILSILRPFTWSENSSAVKDWHVRNHEGFMFVYSTTSRKSFNEISGIYQEILQIKGGVPFCAVLVATKSDLEEGRQVSTQEGRKLAKRLHCQFIEASSKTATNVEESFYTLVREIRSNKEAQSKSDNRADNLADNPANRSRLYGCRCLVL